MDKFLNSSNVKDFNLTEVMDSFLSGELTYGYGDDIQKVTRLEILSDGTINLYGI